uniref:Acrosin-binding protein n=1 Tax=Calidris pygmaea TaxID=425635 RepID=A0A8C3JWU5_9CHAR
CRELPASLLPSDKCLDVPPAALPDQKCLLLSFPGTPLSNQEYRQFFRYLRVAQRASTACLLRELYGCQYTLVQGLDEYENHGAIPKGKADHDYQGQADGWGSCTARIGPDCWKGTETHELVEERVG